MTTKIEPDLSEINFSISPCNSLRTEFERTFSNYLSFSNYSPFCLWIYHEYGLEASVMACVFDKIFSGIVADPTYLILMGMNRLMKVLRHCGNREKRMNIFPKIKMTQLVAKLWAFQNNYSNGRIITDLCYKTSQKIGSTIKSKMQSTLPIKSKMQSNSYFSHKQLLHHLSQTSSSGVQPDATWWHILDRLSWDAIETIIITWIQYISESSSEQLRQWCNDAAPASLFAAIRIKNVENLAILFQCVWHYFNFYAVTKIPLQHTLSFVAPNVSQLDLLPQDGKYRAKSKQLKKDEKPYPIPSSRLISPPSKCEPLPPPCVLSAPQKNNWMKVCEECGKSYDITSPSCTECGVNNLEFDINIESNLHYTNEEKDDMDRNKNTPQKKLSNYYSKKIAECESRTCINKPKANKIDLKKKIERYYNKITGSLQDRYPDIYNDVIQFRKHFPRGFATIILTERGIPFWHLIVDPNARTDAAVFCLIYRSMIEEKGLKTTLSHYIGKLIREIATNKRLAKYREFNWETWNKICDFWEKRIQTYPNLYSDRMRSELLQTAQIFRSWNSVGNKYTQLVTQENINHSEIEEKFIKLLNSQKLAKMVKFVDPEQCVDFFITTQDESKNITINIDSLVKKMESRCKNIPIEIMAQIIRQYLPELKFELTKDNNGCIAISNQDAKYNTLSPMSRDIAQLCQCILDVITNGMVGTLKIGDLPMIISILNEIIHHFFSNTQREINLPHCLPSLAKLQIVFDHALNTEFRQQFNINLLDHLQLKIPVRCRSKRWARFYDDCILLLGIAVQTNTIKRISADSTSSSEIKKESKQKSSSNIKNKLEEMRKFILMARRLTQTVPDLHMDPYTQYFMTHLGSFPMKNSVLFA